MECGPGHRERYAICRDHQGFIVDSSKCKEVGQDKCELRHEKTSNVVFEQV